jgi:hypothetical protein
LAGIDLAATGIGALVVDGANRPLLDANLGGQDLVGTVRGWRLAEPRAGIEQLEARLGATATLVSMKATLPAVELVDGNGAPDTSGVLYGRLRFGGRCAHRFTLACTVSARSRFRCTDG